MKFSYEKDTQQTLTKFVQLLRNQNKTFKPALVQKFSRIKVYNILAVPSLYGSEIWTLRKRDKNRLTSIEMNSFSEELRGTPYLTTKERRRFVRAESRAS